jgi:hypothetical protein
VVWKEPELPPVQKMPRKRSSKGSSLLGRAIGGVAGLAMGTTSALGLVRALRDTSGQASPFMALALLLPTVVLIRYALTGQIRM